MNLRRFVLFNANSLALVAALVGGSASADVAISTGTTQNMSCSGDVCQPTANNAVLNVADLEKFLAQGATTVTTTGSDGVQAEDILILSGLTWTSTNALTLNAWHNISIHKPVSIDGVTGLNLNTGQGGSGGSLLLPKKGSITFVSLASQLTINGATYTLVGDIKTLAADIASDPGGNFALAQNYDASADGTYSTSPISTPYSGIFEGLGHQIQNLAIDDPNYEIIGFIAQLNGGRISNISLANSSVSGENAYAIGTLLGYSSGTVTGSDADGSITASASYAGGLIGVTSGTIDRSHASVTISVAKTYSVVVAGLVGWNYGTISASYATGTVSASRTTATGYVAGLVAYNDGNVRTSFATGSVKDNTTQSNPACAGLVAINDRSVGTIENAYATGRVSCNSGFVGGLASDNYNTIQRSYSIGRVYGQTYAGFLERNSDSLTRDYWDITTSGTDNGVWKGPSHGLIGLTTRQLRSGLPPGFSPTIWAEDSKINNGLPYLINNPPPQ